MAFEEVADISNVPVDQLQRVARLMITAGFLCETTNGQVAHTPLSASFVMEPALLDAAMFLAKTAVPAALKMPLTVQQGVVSDIPQQWAAHATTVSGERFDASQPRAQRQFGAYFAHGVLDEASAVVDVLKLVDWKGLGSATIVDVS